MIAYLANEIKGAALWLRETILSIFRWMFRWVLRLCLLGLLLFGFGGGCHFLSNAFRSEDQKQVVDSAPANDVKPKTEQPSSAPPQYTRESPKPSMQTQVKSTWSVLNRIVRDVERFFRRR